MALGFDGAKSKDFRFEPGGHRFQRTPPTERNGRVHTSTVTVALISADASADTRAEALDESDLLITWFSGTGKGGQNRNKVQASCRLLHKPTGLTAKAECRTRETSYRAALDALTLRVQQEAELASQSALAAKTRSQVGSGMRGDKTRTYRLQDDTVTDHRLERQTSWRRIKSGDFSAIYG